MSVYEINARQFEGVVDAILKFSDGSEAEKVINDYLGGAGADTIKQGIQGLLPASGRTWSGKKAAASATDPFRKQLGNLQVSIKTKYGYHYLYFPDDGSDTIHHAGNQQFMFQGADQKAEEVGNEIINKLLERLEV